MNTGNFLEDRRDEIDAIRIECEMSEAEAALWIVTRESLEAIQSLQERVAALESRDVSRA